MNSILSLPTPQRISPSGHRDPASFVSVSHSTGTNLRKVWNIGTPPQSQESAHHRGGARWA